MTKKYSFYCWMRVMPAGSAATSGTILSGGRPPPMSSANKLAGVEETWVAHELFYDKPPSAKTVLRYDHAYADEKEAKDWIETPAGKTWAAEALNYSLMTFKIEV